MMALVQSSNKNTKNSWKYVLYGDGIHDDAPAIQERIDSGVCEVVLPAPKKHYLIRKTLYLPSNFRLVLPRFAEIRLDKQSNCLMLSNRMRPDYQERLPKEHSNLCKHLWYYVNEYADEIMTENIEICGGIWNCNNTEQLPNPEQTEGFGPYGYTGEGMLFYGVNNIKLSSLTLKDPVHWGISFDRVSYFTVEDLTFDYNLGNPMAINMDGVHLNGNCHFGTIRNLKGTCYDDLVALNAHEGSKGPISHIKIDGLFAENCHSAVRLLTVSDDVEHIHITNVFGTYYQYCIGLTKYYEGETTGKFDAVTIDHIHASKAVRGTVYPWPDSYIYPFIYLQENTWIGKLKIADVYRKEYNVPVETLYIGESAVVEELTLENINVENHTGEKMSEVVQRGNVNKWKGQDLKA